MGRDMIERLTALTVSCCVALGLVILAGLGAGCRARGASVDLVSGFSSAQKRSNLPVDRAFRVETVTIRGISKRCIFAEPTSRITWRVTPPPYGWLSTSLALEPAAWDAPGDGVLFRVGVSDGHTYEELLNQVVDPAHVPGDRRWVAVSVDLSAYAGRQVDLIFNTNASSPGKEADTRNDLAVWGQPEIRAGGR